MPTFIEGHCDRLHHLTDLIPDDNEHGVLRARQVTLDGEIADFQGNVTEAGFVAGDVICPCLVFHTILDVSGALTLDLQG